MTSIFSAAGRAAIAPLLQPTTLFAFDFDGTLAPLVKDRHAARLPRAVAKRLRALAARWPRVAVVTGRAIGDMAVKLEGIAVAGLIGNHGSEWEIGSRAGRLHPPLAALHQLRRALATVNLGDHLEDKGFSLSIHLRGLGRSKLARVEELVSSATGVEAFGGKAIINAIPAGAAHKGDGLVRLVKALRARAALYVGDDVTDEFAFRVRLPVPHVTIRVGRVRNSAARFCLQRQRDIERLLDLLLGAGKA